MKITYFVTMNENAVEIHLLNSSPLLPAFEILQPSFLEILITSFLDISESYYFFCSLNQIDENSLYFALLVYSRMVK